MSHSLDVEGHKPDPCGGWAGSGVGPRGGPPGPRPVSGVGRLPFADPGAFFPYGRMGFLFQSFSLLPGAQLPTNLRLATAVTFCVGLTEGFLGLFGGLLLWLPAAGPGWVGDQAGRRV